MKVIDLNRNYAPAPPYVQERLPGRYFRQSSQPERSGVRGYGSIRKPPGAAGKTKKRKNPLRIGLPFVMITGAMVLSLLIVKSDFIASPTPTPSSGALGGATIETEYTEHIEDYDAVLTYSGEPEVSLLSQNAEDGDQSLKKLPSDKYLMLINKDNVVERDYRPGNMVDIHKQVNSLNHPVLLERTAAEAFKDMMHAIESAKEEDSRIETLVAISGYRTYEYQENLFNKEVKENLKTMSKEHAEIVASRLVALPGGSEHQAGLAIDVSTTGLAYKLLEDFEDTACYAWLKENCADFGFIIRYPKNKTEITGISYEPWHLRYVGAEHAKVIMKEDLTLEEYIERTF